ncbi:MAG TPA: SURF1 family protein [Gemmatimonadaceae bacterium]|nr:SURF1 family protein [Gemmatimonadaceae bacterium]
MRRPYLLLAFSLAAAALCVRLGIWQLARLEQRRARNSLATERLGQQPEDIARISSDTGAVRFRRIHASGVFDYDRELARAFQSRNGSPGVHLLTPFKRAGSDTLVIVVRGWVYAPDAKTTDFPRWRERDSVTLDGYALPFVASGGPSDSIAGAARAVSRLDLARLAARVGAPIAGYYLVMTSSAEKGDSIPNRLGEPVLNDGPHLSYAVQWFLFATIFGAGGTVVVVRGRRKAAAGG